MDQYTPNKENNNYKEPKHYIHEFSPHDGGITSMVYDQIDLTKLYTSSYDGTIRLLDVKSEKFQQVTILTLSND